MNEQFGVGLDSGYLVAKKCLWSPGTMMMKQCARELCAGGAFTECVDQGDPIGWSTNMSHPKDRPTEHWEERPVKEVVKKHPLLTSYPVTLCMEEEEERAWVTMRPKRRKEDKDNEEKPKTEDWVRMSTVRMRKRNEGNSGSWTRPCPFRRFWRHLSGGIWQIL